jgi:hypothetical protein
MNDEIIEIFQGIKRWHQIRIDQLNEILAHDSIHEIKLVGKEDKSDEDALALTSQRDIQIFKLGARVGLDLFEKLPFTLHNNDEREEINDEY